MTALEIIFAAASLALQAFAIATIAYGIFRMGRASDQRAACEDARHAEAMRALEAIIKGMETVIERTGGRA